MCHFKTFSHSVSRVPNYSEQITKQYIRYLINVAQLLLCYITTKRKNNEKGNTFSSGSCNYTCQNYKVLYILSHISRFTTLRTRHRYSESMDTNIIISLRFFQSYGLNISSLDLRVLFIVKMRSGKNMIKFNKLLYIYK